MRSPIVATVVALALSGFAPAQPRSLSEMEEGCLYHHCYTYSDPTEHAFTFNTEIHNYDCDSANCHQYVVLGFCSVNHSGCGGREVPELLAAIQHDNLSMVVALITRHPGRFSYVDDRQSIQVRNCSDDVIASIPFAEWKYRFAEDLASLN